MAVIFDSDNRRVIPNWRRLERTAFLGELGSVGSKSVQTFSREDIIDNIIAWNKNNTIGHAGDLISSALVTNLTDISEVQNAASFIIGHKKDSPEALINSSKKIVTKEGKAESFLDNQTIEDFEEKHHAQYVQKRISILRNSLHRLPRNSIKRVEIARLYSLLGQDKPASKSMKIALDLSPNNRFVLRSSARLFVHIGDFEVAHAPLRNSKAIKYDPWLISTEVAIATLRDRHSRFAKTGFKQLSSGDYSRFDTAELSSSLATLELYSGSHKNAKKLFRNSLIDPNDNALAQYEWASNYDNSLSGYSAQNRVLNPYEALALESYHAEDWEKTITHVINWFLDLPFSKRPVVLGSFIALTYLENYDLAIKLCEAGLYANPNNPTLINNLAYSIASQGEPKKALKILTRFDNTSQNEINKSQQIALAATRGFIYFRLNMHDAGRNQYKKAIKNAEKEGSSYYQSLAYLNLLREELRLEPETSESKLLRDKIDNLVTDSSHRDVIWLKEKILRR